MATAAAILFLVLVGVLGVGSGGHDDSHITFWVADAVARGWGFVNYDGDAVEQSSSLTFVVLLAGLHVVTRLPVPLLGYGVGVVAGAAAVVQGHRLAERLAPGMGPVVAWMTASVFALVYWSTSGVEASLAAALTPTLVLAVGDVVGEGGRPPGRGRLLMLLAVALAFTGVRPEYTLVSLGVAVALVVFGWRLRVDRTRVFAAAGVVTASVAAVVGFRVRTFGATLPNPVHIKAGGFDLAQGAAYLVHAAIDSNVVLVVAGAAGAGLGVRVLVASAARDEPHALTLGLSSALVVALLAFPVAVGGDWMEHGRFLVPAVAMLAASTAALARFVAPGRPTRARLGLAAIAVVGLVTGARPTIAEYERSVGLREALRRSRAFAEIATPTFPAVELANQAHLRDAPLVLALLEILDELGPTAQSPITLASGQAGMVPYYTALEYYRRIRFIDMFSITTDAVARCWPGAVYSRTRLGSQLLYPKILQVGALERRCGIARPDIVFNSTLPSAGIKETLKRHGYVVLYKQSGWAFGDTALWGYIAVRADLVAKAGLRRRQFDW